MLLTCPTCRSGLQVPDGTTAQVRCPTCKTVFSAAARPPSPPAPAKPIADRPRPKPVPPRPAEDDDRPRRRSRREVEDDDPPRRRRQADEVNDAADEPEAEQSRRKKRPADGLTTEQRAERKAVFRRGAWGARLIWISFLCYGGGMLLLCVYFVHKAVISFTNGEPVPLGVYFILAGLLGLCNWIVGAVGIGLSLSGPKAPGLQRFGIAAAVAAGVHAVLLLVVVIQAGKVESKTPDGTLVPTPLFQWRQLPTQMDTLTIYLTLIAYPDDYKPELRNAVGIALVTGLVEVVRLVLLMMLLSSLARASGDVDLNRKCTRAAGYVAWGPVAVAVVVLLTMVMVVETGAQYSSFGKIVLSVLSLGITAMVTSVLVPAMSAARDVTEACESPFQSQVIDLGG